MTNDKAFSIWSFISSCFDGQSKAYIYIWFSKICKVAYVGETNNRYGSFGRAWQHLQTNGTLRSRFEERVGLSIEKADDLILVSFLLPNDREFIGVESSYREAVEYLVQIGLREKRGDLTPSFDLISRVRPNDRISDQAIKEIADNIVADFVSNYSPKAL